MSAQVTICCVTACGCMRHIQWHRNPGPKFILPLYYRPTHLMPLTVDFETVRTQQREFEFERRDPAGVLIYKEVQ